MLVICCNAIVLFLYQQFFTSDALKKSKHLCSLLVDYCVYISELELFDLYTALN